MKTTKLFLFAAMGALALSSCRKELPTQATDDTAPASIYDLKVSDQFNFKSTKDLSIQVKIASPSFQGEKFRINIYDDFPTIGNLITSGITDAGYVYRDNIRVSASMENIFIEKVKADGSTELTKLKANQFVSTTFNGNTPVVMMKKKPSSGMNCAVTGATTNNAGSFNSTNGNIGTVQLTNSNGSLSVQNMTSGTLDIHGNYSGSIAAQGGLIVISGTYTGTINANNGGSGVTVKVCGIANNLTLNLNSSNDKVYFVENSIVSITTLALNNSNVVAQNFSDSLKFNGNFAIGGQFTNNGKMSVNGDLDVNNNNNNFFVNNGEVYVRTNLNNNRSLTNNNKITVGGDYKANNPSANINNCYLSVGNEFHINTTFNNNSYVKVYGKTSSNGGSNLIMGNGAQLSTKDLEFNGNIAGGNSLSMVKVSNFTRINNGSSISGGVKLCDATGIDVNNNQNMSTSYFSCNTNNYIPTSACNPEGFGQPQIQDADNDGVADAQDAYPNDPLRASNSYYPTANTYATLGFEDLWPAQGDYDFNDLVVTYRITKVLNAAGNVVDIKNDVMVRAIGATYDNGFGFQFDEILSSEVQNVTGYSLSKNMITLNGNKTEAGNTKAVVIAFDSPNPLVNRPAGSMFNTIKGNPSGTFDTIHLVINFTTPLAPSKVAMDKINPFIFINGVRGNEVHLPNFVPTAKADLSKLGTVQDNSNPSIGRYYKTKNNLPFVLEIPESFDYPAEKESIMSAFNYFAAWAQSGGTSSTNWYKDLPGYRDNTKIY